MPKITFLGAAGTVTGSKYLIEAEGKKLLVDSGLFEGSKDLKQRNWDKLPIDPAKIHRVLAAARLGAPAGRRRAVRRQKTLYRPQAAAASLHRGGSADRADAIPRYSEQR